MLELIVELIGLGLIYGLFKAMGGNGAVKRIDFQKTQGKRNLFLRSGIVVFILVIIALTVLQVAMRVVPLMAGA
jgi:hypothetical protein